jgi:hypothetical protein
MNAEKPTLIFVYNADSGLFNLLTDIAHKIFSPQTYNCNLCAVTHDKFGIKDEWRQYLKTLDAPVEFLHADEFKAKYRTGDTEKLPAVFKKENGKIELAINSNAINACADVNDLKRIINAQISDTPMI